MVLLMVVRIDLLVNRLMVVLTRLAMIVLGLGLVIPSSSILWVVVALMVGRSGVCRLSV